MVEEELLELEDLDLVEGHLRCVGKARQAPEVMADPVERHAVGVVRLEEGEGRVGLVVALFQAPFPVIGTIRAFASRPNGVSGRKRRQRVSAPA